MTFATLFQIVEGDDPDDARRLTLTGELDIASAPELQDRMQELGADQRRIRLDLSELDFMDSSGISTILAGLQAAASEGWNLEVDPKVTPQVARLVTLMGLDDRFWSPSGR